MFDINEYWRRFQLLNKTNKKPHFFTRYDTKHAFKDLDILPGTTVFVLRILKTLLFQQKVCVYSDYDADAVNAVAVTVWMLRILGLKDENITTYTPDRFTESYGVNTPAIKKLSQSNDLIITVDCGITALEQVHYLSSKPCEMVITDHHSIQNDEIPKALAVLNPQLFTLSKKKKVELLQRNKKNTERIIETLRNFCDPEMLTQCIEPILEREEVALLQRNSHVSSSLVGAGVIWWLFLWYSYASKEFVKITSQAKYIDPKVLESLLPFVAIATVADCQSILESTNRTLVKAGITAMKSQSLFPGLETLLRSSGLREKTELGYSINSIDLGYTVAPLLNVPGRIAHANLAVEFLITNTFRKSEESMRHINEMNIKRKKMIVEIMNTMAESIANQVQSNQKYIWIEGAINRGVTGLIASRLTNDYSKIAFVFSRTEEGLVGSIRSPEGFDIMELLEPIKDNFSAFGGHTQAAGVTITSENILYVRNAIDEIMRTAVVKQKKHIQYFSHNQLLSLPLHLHSYGQLKHVVLMQETDITTKTLETVWKLDPFGQDFPLPYFLFRVTDPTVRLIGTTGDHYKITLTSGVQATLFYAKRHQKELLKSSDFWLLTKPSQNVFRGILNHELIIEQVLPSYV